MLPFVAKHAANITPHDTNPNVYGALYVGGAGNIEVVTQGGQTVLISGIPAGTLLPIAVAIVKSTNTTATLIVGLNG